MVNIPDDVLRGILNRLESSLPYRIPGYPNVREPTKLLRTYLPKVVVPPVGTLDGLSDVHPILRRKGGLSVNVGPLCDGWAQVRTAGITAICPQISALGAHDASTAQNVEHLKSGIVHTTFPAGVIGGWGTHGANPKAEANHVITIINEQKLLYYGADTERHHLTGHPEYTDELLRLLREGLGATFPLFAVTFGYSPDSQGQIVASQNVAMARHGVAFLKEAYGPSRNRGGIQYADGSSWGLDNVIPYLEREGLKPPHWVCLGDKSIPEDVDYMKDHPGKVKYPWVWAPEQALGDLYLLGSVT